METNTEKRTEEHEGTNRTTTVSRCHGDSTGRGHRDETGPNRHNKNHRIRNVKNENSDALGTKDRAGI